MSDSDARPTNDEPSDDQGTALVLVAHGSRAAIANDSHVALCRELSQRTGREVHPAFLELAEPTLPEALDGVAAGHRRVVVLPHFLLPGNHTQRDIPAAIDAARERHDDVTFDQLDHVGASPAMVDLVQTLLP